MSPADYSVLEQTLARRTFDESGDYVVQDFSIDIREYAQKDGNRGLYAADEFGLYNGLSATEAGRKMIASIGPGKAYIRGYEIVNKETKYLEINKARESLSSDNVTLKTKGLPTYTISNVYGSVPLNKEGSQLTAYPTVYLSCLFNDGYVGLSNTELDSNYRQTIDRRGKFFDSNIGIKTVTLEIVDVNIPISSIIASDLENTFSKLWYVKTRAGTNIVSYVDVLSYSKVFKPLKNPGTTEESRYLEVTVAGTKSDLENIFKEYDESSQGKNRKVFLTENDAIGDEKENLASTIFANVIDYSETITPVIGTAKPNNFYLEERGEGFNPDSDNVISKGTLSQGGDAYNAKFALSYFDPQFFTRIVLENVVPTNSYGVGEYVYGLTSGAYGVVEGAPNGVYSTGKILFVKTLSGKFVPGETVRDEAGNLVKIAKENTISHFIVQERGLGYPSTSTIVVDGVGYDQSQVELGFNGQGIYRVDIVDRVSFAGEYSKPPVVTINSGDNVPTTSAVIVPVLNRNTVTTYTPQNVKSFGSSYGSGNVNQFTADSVVDDRDFANVTSVTDFTFFGSKGTKFLESTSFSADASSIVQQGDLIQFSDASNNVIRAIVQYATIQKGSAKTRIYIDETLYDDVTSTSVVLLRPRIKNPNSGTLLFPTGSKQVQKISAGSDDTKIKYFFRRDFVTAGSTGGGVISFAAQLPFGTQRFTSFNEKNYIVTVLNKNSADLVEDGDIVYIDEDNVEVTSATDTASGLTSGSITFRLPTSYFNSTSVEDPSYVAPELKLTATLEVSNAKPRLKTAIKNKRIVFDSAGDRVIPFRGPDYDSEFVEHLSLPDASRLL